MFGCAAGGGGPPGLAMPGRATNGTAPAVPAVMPACRDTLEDLRRTRRHPDEDTSAAPHNDSPANKCCVCCRFCLALFCFIVASPFLLLGFLLVLCLAPLAAWLLKDSTPEEDEEESRSRSSHSPSFMRPPGARAAPGPSAAMPANLQGVYYLRGSPFDLAEICFERGEWDAERRLLKLPFRCPRARMFKTSKKAALEMAVRWITKFHSEFEFKDAEEGGLLEARIHLKVWEHDLPDWLVLVTMKDASKDKDGSLWKFEVTSYIKRWAPWWAERVVDNRSADTPYIAHVRREVARKCILI